MELLPFPLSSTESISHSLRRLVHPRTRHLSLFIYGHLHVKPDGRSNSCIPARSRKPICSDEVAFTKNLDLELPSYIVRLPSRGRL